VACEACEWLLYDGGAGRLVDRTGNAVCLAGGGAHVLPAPRVSLVKAFPGPDEFMATLLSELASGSVCLTLTPSVDRRRVGAEIEQLSRGAALWARADTVLAEAGAPTLAVVAAHQLAVLYREQLANRRAEQANTARPRPVPAAPAGFPTTFSCTARTAAAVAAELAAAPPGEKWQPKFVPSSPKLLPRRVPGASGVIEAIEAIERARKGLK
jgi:hypothetical protein